MIFRNHLLKKLFFTINNIKNFIFFLFWTNIFVKTIIRMVDSFSKKVQNNYTYLI